MGLTVDIDIHIGFWPGENKIGYIMKFNDQ